eukprot:1236123-Rhodomonas_salina.1
MIPPLAILSTDANVPAFMPASDGTAGNQQECTVDLPDTPQGRWWMCERCYLNPAIPGQYIFEGRAYEPAGGRDYSITSDTLAHALHLTAETMPMLEVD